MRRLPTVLSLICSTVLLFCSLPGSVRAQTSYPMLMSIEPSAAQVGESSEHVIHSRYSMFGAYEVLVTGEGVTGEIVTPMELDKDGNAPSLTKITVKFTVEPDAPEGVRDVRLATPQGASTLGQLVIVRDPVVYEGEKNDTPEGALPIELPATVCGVIEKAEDLDFFKFQIDEPTTLNFHCYGMRLQDKIHDLQQHVDPILTIRNANGSVVAIADKAYAADPFLSHNFKQPGEYTLEVRDVRYQGNRYWQYVIEIHDRPFVATVHPLAIPRGEATPVKLIGSALPENAEAELVISEETPLGTTLVQPVLDGVKLNPVQVYVSEERYEIEGLEENGTVETAQPIAVPGGVCGQIGEEADIDVYKFQASKGDRFTFEVVARRLWSSLDPILAVTNAEGRTLSENDDLRLWGKRTYQDSMIENWTAPEDGEYFLQIRDVHLRGGDAFTYALKAVRAEPTFELVLDTDKTQLTPGTAGVLFARAIRKNGFEGEIQLAIDGLPDGVTATCGRILADGNDGCIILEAEEDAELAVANVRVTGTAVVGEEEDQREISVAGQPMQETYMPGGGRNHWPVEMHTVAVGAPSDIRAVKLDQYDIQLKPGESVRIGIEIERAEAFDKNVTLDLLFQHLRSVYADTLPKGVTINARESKTVINANETEGHITLTAADDAPPVEDQLCSVMANVSLNFVMKATYSSRPVRVTVTE
jgi:hypothetical protein